MDNQPFTTPTGQSDQRKLLVRINIILAIVCAALIVLALAGTGKVVVDLPSDTKVTLNGHSIDPSATKKIRHGTYTLTVKSPIFVTTEQQVHVGAFKTTTILEDSLKKRDVTDILTSVMPASGFYGTPSFTSTKWFTNNTWLVGVVGPGSAGFAALHYANGGWTVPYYTDPGFSQDYSVMPADVAAYLKGLHAQYEQQD